MAEEDYWNPRLLGGDPAVQGPEVADDLVPAALVGEVAEIRRRGLRPMPAMIVGVSPVARGVERAGDTRIAAAVLGEAVGDLHDRARRTFGQPTPRQEVLTVIGAKLEFAPRHSVPYRCPKGAKPRIPTRNLAPIHSLRQARGRCRTPFGLAKFTPRRIGWDRLGAESNGAVYLHHRRRGLLSWQGSRFSGFRRASAGARLYRPPAQARPLSQCRSGHDEPDPAWRGVRHRRWRRDRPRPRPLRALHRAERQPARQYHR